MRMKNTILSAVFQRIRRRSGRRTASYSRSLLHEDVQCAIIVGVLHGIGDSSSPEVTTEQHPSIVFRCGDLDYLLRHKRMR